MKTLRILLSVSLIFVVHFNAQGNRTLQLTSNIPALKKASADDSIQFIERLAAYYFHLNINAYRKAQNAPELAWDDTLWLACRNHSIWMVENHKLSHDENKGSPFFSGSGPGDRIKYVTSGKSRLSWSGENALYNYDARGKTVSDIAKNIADGSFYQWKNSPGHNRNMLNKGSYAHGVAFIIKEGTVWSTDLFIYPPYNYTPVPFQQPSSSKFKAKSNLKSVDVSAVEEKKKDESPIVLELPDNTRKDNTTTVKTSKTVSVSKTEKELNNFISKQLFVKTAKTDKALQTAAQKHLAYIISSKNPESAEEKGKRNFYAETPEKRVLKASHYTGFFKNKRTALTEHVVMISIDAENFSNETATSMVQSAIDASRKEQNCNEAFEKGYAVKIKKEKGNYVIYLVVLERALK